MVSHQNRIKIILPCPEVRLRFSTHACNAISQLCSAHSDVFNQKHLNNVLLKDRFGYLATLESLVYAKAVEEATGCQVLMKMKYRHRNQLFENLINPIHLGAENQVASRLKSFGDYFLSQSGFMQFSGHCQGTLSLELLLDDDVMITNYI